MAKKVSDKGTEAVPDCKGTTSRVWIYCRVASRDIFALEMQKQRLQDYAAAHSWNIVGISADQRAGTTMSHSSLAAADKAISNGEVDVMLVSDLSRLCRSTVEVLAYWDFLRSHGVSLHTIAEGTVDLSVTEEIYNALKSAAGTSF